MACVVPAPPVSLIRMGAMPCVASSRRRPTVVASPRRGLAGALRRVGVVLSAGLLLAFLLVGGAAAKASLGTVPVDALPPQGRAVLAEIRAGGPFAFRRDGIVFGNREGRLPSRPRGYYAEFTVPTPGDRTRGPRRIIAGRGTTGDVRTSDEYYYTDDHYQSFRRIVQ